MPHQIIGPGSLLKRPDAVSSDYLIAHSFGPIQVGDNTQGALNRVWRVRSVGADVFLERQANVSSYDPPTLLFSMAAPYPEEVDLAFDQNGQFVVTCQRPTGVDGVPQVWLYWFNSLVGEFQFSNFGNGRNPRILLDDGNVSATWSDVLLFYMNDAAGSLAYRQQRDRYQTEYLIAAVPAANSYVEDAYRSIDNRIHVLFSVHDIASGTYQLDHIESLLYPYEAGGESLAAGHSFRVGSELRTVQIQDEAEIEEFKAGLAILPGTLVSFVVEYSRDPEEFKAGWEARAGSELATIVTEFPGDQREQEMLKAAMLINNGALVTVVFEYSRGSEDFKAGLVILGASFA